MQRYHKMNNMKLLKKKVLITGANGLLGQKLVEVFSREYTVQGVGTKPEPLVMTAGYGYTVCDITNRQSVVDLVKSLAPDYIINSAAYTDVDGSEDDRENCWRVNVTGVENLVCAAAKVKAFLVHVSTDYVFDGVKGNYDETSTPNPLGYYGRSKLAGENAIIKSDVQAAIVRTMVLYGVGRGLRPNFATWLTDKLSKGEAVRIVDDQYGHPTLVDDLALAIRRIAQLAKPGIYHVTGRECDSRFAFATKLADVFGFEKSLISRIKTGDLNQKAPRPLISSFNLEKLEKEVGVELSDIREGLEKFRRQLNDEEN